MLSLTQKEWSLEEKKEEILFHYKNLQVFAFLRLPVSSGMGPENAMKLKIH